MSATASLNSPLGPDELQGFAAVINLLARASEFDTVLRSNHESNDNRLHFGYSEAAKLLNIPERWLRDHLNEIPHRRLGKFVQFTKEDLCTISDMHFVQPDQPAGKQDAFAATPPLRPSGRSRSRS